MKRGGIKERRDAINGQLNALADEMRQGQEAISRLRATAENNLALAKFAEGWKLKEVEAIAKT
jgi:vacuolar-type H+-ATPase subunit D/Vma8